MGKRARTTAYRARFSEIRALRLPALCVLFALGAVFGHVTAQIVGGDSALATYLRGAASAETAATASIFSVLATYFRYPLLALLLGYCSFGAAAIALLLAVQGFTLSFAAASLAASLGRQGVFLALASFGLRSIITVVCTLLIALWVLEKASGSSEKKSGTGGNIIALCFLVLALGVILELTVVPKLFSLALAALK